jgi:hypothetical protein
MGNVELLGCLVKGTEYQNICRRLREEVVSGTEYRNISRFNLTVLCTFGTISHLFILQIFWCSAPFMILISVVTVSQN